MEASEYLSYDALGLAGLVRGGEVSASQLAPCAKRPCRAVESPINAVLELFSDADSIVDAAANGATFSGVPLLIKGLVIQAEGRRNEMGSWLAAPQDSDQMTRFRQAGLLTLARSQDGLPIGIQCVAPYGREDLLLSLAAVFEQAMPWPKVAPQPG